MKSSITVTALLQSGSVLGVMKCGGTLPITDAEASECIAKMAHGGNTDDIKPMEGCL